jgi:putative tryptophan/tyrosine transport system substrate-binding protein
VKRRVFLISTGAALGAATSGLLAQISPAPKRVGGLYLGTKAPSPLRTTFESRLRELGWIEGKNLVLVNRFAEGALGRIDSLAREIAAKNVDVIHVPLPTPTRAARKAAPNTPIVFSIISDPVGEGLVSSLARPGGNLTGASTREAELGPKRLQLVKDLVPGARRVVIVLDTPPPAGILPLHKKSLDDLAGVGAGVGLKVDFASVATPAEVAPLFDRLAKERVDAVMAFIYWRLITAADRKVFIDNAARVRIPAIYTSAYWVELGGLATYTQNLSELGRRAADYVDKILRGAKPADLPVEEPNAFELSINMKAAKAIGLTVSQAVLLRADRVIE